MKTMNRLYNLSKDPDLLMVLFILVVLFGFGVAFARGSIRLVINHTKIRRRWGHGIEAGNDEASFRSQC